MNDLPEDKVRSAWSAQTDREGGVDTASMVMAAERRAARIRRRDRGVYVSAVLIIPSWAAAFVYMPDLRLLSLSGLLAALWLTWHTYRRSGARLNSSSFDLPCAEFQRELIRHELDLYAAMPRWYLPPIVACQVLIIITLLTNPRFEKDGRFAVGLVMFVGTATTAIVVTHRRWRHEATELQREIAALEGGFES